MNRNITIGIAAIVVVAVIIVAIVLLVYHPSISSNIANANKPNYTDLLANFNASSFSAVYVFHVRTLLIENNTVVANQSSTLDMKYNQSSSSFSVAITQNGNTTLESATLINSTHYKVCITFVNGTETCNTEPAANVSSPIYSTLVVLNATQYKYIRTINLLGNYAYCYANTFNATAPSIYGIETVLANDMNCLYSNGVPAYISFNVTDALYPQGSTTPFATQLETVTGTISQLNG